MRRLLFNNVFFLFFIMLMMVSISASSMDIRSMKFSTPDGLADNTVREILQDKRGYIWLATSNGLSRYDGYNMMNYVPMNGSHPSVETQIRKLLEDSHGYLWLLLNNDKVSCLNLSTDRFEEFPYTDSNYRYIKEMSDGSIWLWGESGLLKVVCGESGLNYEKIEASGKTSLPKNIWRVQEDKGGRVLISTDKGLYAYVHGNVKPVDTQRLYQWIRPVSDGVLLISAIGEIVKLNDDGTSTVLHKIEGIESRNDLPGEFVKNGKWYVTSSRGGVTVDLESGAIERFNPSNEVFAAQVITDNIGDVWLHNESGVLYFMDTEHEKLFPLRLIPAEMLKLLTKERFAIIRDESGRAWIATAGNGLFVYDPATGDLKHFTTDGGNFQVIPTDELLSITIDNQDNIWVGTEYGGVVTLKANNKEVSTLRLPKSDGKKIAVRMIKKTPSGDIIISSRDGNEYVYSSDLKQLKSAKRGPVVYDAAFDKEGNLWEATRGHGLLRNGEYMDRNILDTTSDDIYALRYDSKDRLWVSAFGSGLDIVSKVGDGYETIHLLNGNYGERRIRIIFEDKDGNIWAGTNAGVFLFESGDISFNKTSGRLFDVAGGFLRSNEIHDIAQDTKGRIWLGEARNGVTILDLSKDVSHPEVIHIGTESGLANNSVQSFVKDGDEYMWVTTLYGVSRVNVNTLGVESFVFQSTPTANVHSDNSAVMLDDGRLLLGTSLGAYTVDTDQISSNNSGQEIAVTSFRVNGERIAFIPDGDRIKEKNGEYVITLPHDSNSIDFEFSTFDFNWPKTTKFRYRLNPVDKEWNEATVDNMISFKNLSPGKYTLIVEVCGPNAVWNKMVQYEIVIKTPWWESWLARTIYVTLILVGCFFVLKVVERFNQLHNKIKVEEQLTDYKLEFFTNISHEFRTPLTLIQVSLEKLHDKLSALKSDNPGMSLSGLNIPLATLDKNSRRMSRLIDELLTFRKVEKNKMVLFPEPTEVIGFIREIYENFREEATSKHLDFEFIANRNEFNMNIDRNALDKIANNLISNALKYTREGGKVLLSVNVREAEKKLEIKVIDNGVGIPAEKREQLFTRFMQSAMSRNSIGVGLHLTFGLVELHKGKIFHTDNPGGGSIFTVILPTDMSASEHRPQDGIGKPVFETIFKATDEDTEATDNTLPSIKNKKKMLIIDDDADIRGFLSTEFQKYFDILTASDGRSGLEVARNNEVHIIICDVMMPDISGFEVTRLLKEDFATSHIPIIQLTALSNDDCYIEGITSGADAYVTKPFNLKFLKTRVAKLIEQRDNLFARFSATPKLSRPQLPMGEKDQEFADRLAAVAQKNIDNSEFTVDDFAAEMALGRTIFFRKVKGVTGYAPKEYLRVMRMKKAAEMLLSTDMTITEISYRVGISDPAYFNKCFKAQFGKAPSVYQKENTAPADPTQYKEKE